MSNTKNESSKVEWNKVNWRKAESAVFKLQKRIYLAAQREEVKVVRQLQKTLVRSWYAKLLAVRRVTQENKGRKTAGVDGIKSLTPEQRIKLARNLKLDGKSKPTRRVWIPKPGKDEKRPLGIPVMEDRAKQCLLKMALEPEWEAKFEPNSFGFRPGRSQHDAVKAIFLSIKGNPKYVLDADIAKCFDRINHSKLLEKLNTSPRFRRQIKAWLKSGVIDKHEWFPTSEGTPQGGVISPLLANIALHGMEQRISQEFPADKSGKIRRSKSRFGRTGISQPRLIRFADDFVILCEELTVVERCREIITEWLTEIGLELKPSKTRLAHTRNEFNGEKAGFDFLGFTIRQFPMGKHHSGKSVGNRYSKGKLLGHKTIIKPSKSKVKEHYKNISLVIDKYKSGSQVKMIETLNPKIRGWCNYQSPWNAKETFSRLDHLVYQKLRSWAKHRHSNKGMTWVVNKYWRTVGNENWVFTGFSKGKPMLLLRHGKHPAGVEHINVKDVRSPYDGDYVYWSTRMGDAYKILEPQKARLLERQKGKCAHCGLNFKPMDYLEKHHIRPKEKGGNNSDRNMELLHLHCHDLAHGNSNTLTQAK